MPAAVKNTFALLAGRGHGASLWELVQPVFDLGQKGSHQDTGKSQVGSDLFRVGSRETTQFGLVVERRKTMAIHGKPFWEGQNQWEGAKMVAPAEVCESHTCADTLDGDPQWLDDVFTATDQAD